jgi:hypothetical protein
VDEVYLLAHVSGQGGMWARIYNIHSTKYSANTRVPTFKKSRLVVVIITKVRDRRDSNPQLPP